MYAIVKNIQPNSFKATATHNDIFCHNDEFNDGFGMLQYIGKRISVEPIKSWPGWYHGKHVGFYWHSSWLKFQKKNNKAK
jgi:hypothetical protein